MGVYGMRNHHRELHTEYAWQVVSGIKGPDLDMSISSPSEYPHCFRSITADGHDLLTCTYPSRYELLELTTTFFQ